MYLDLLKPPSDQDHGRKRNISNQKSAQQNQMHEDEKRFHLIVLNVVLDKHPSTVYHSSQTI